MQPPLEPLPQHRRFPPGTVARLPTNPVPYPQVLRGPTFRWWRPLLTLLIFGALAVGFQLVFALALLVLRPELAGDHDQGRILGDPVGFALAVAALITLIPAAMIAVRWGTGVPARYLVSVVGGFRGRWALRCLLVVAPIWLILMLVSAATGQFSGGRHPQLVLMIVLVVVLIPLQAAGEEFAFRGVIQQAVGSWFANRWLALVIPAVIGSAGFALAHGSLDGWVLLDLASTAASFTYLTWRTGGLEAAIVTHAVNNTFLMITSLIAGGFELGFVSGNTHGSPVSAGITLLTNLLAIAAISWQARRAGVVRLTQPAAPA